MKEQSKCDSNKSLTTDLSRSEEYLDRQNRPSLLQLSFFLAFLAFFNMEQGNLYSLKSSFACTATHSKNSALMLKSYDWHDGAGVLYFNPKGIKRMAFPHESLQGKPSSKNLAHTWHSRFASVSFNQYGRGFPNGGMNERGLAIEVLWLNETEYTERDQGPYVNELEWVQYVLDTCENIAQVKTLLSTVRISPIHGRVHYFFCDQSGRCGALEFIKGETKLYLDELPIPSLTNHSYEQSLAYAKEQQRINKSTKIKKSNQANRGSLARFLSAQQLSNSTELASLQSGLAALEQVKIKGYTKWQIAYDLKHQTLAFRTNQSSTIKKVDLKELISRFNSASSSFTGCSSIRSYSMSRSEGGALSSLFTPPTFKKERAHLRKRFARLKLPQKLADALADHGRQCSEITNDSPEL